MNDTDPKADTTLDQIMSQDSVGNPEAPAELDPAQLDALLFAQDPGFKEAIVELKSEEIKGDIVEDTFDSGAIESIETRRDKVSLPTKEEANPKIPLRDRLRSFVKGLFAPKQASSSLKTVQARSQRALVNFLTSVKNGVTNFGSLVTKFRSLTLQTKLTILGVVTLAILAVFTVKLMLSGDFLPNLEMSLIPTVAVDADQSWEYRADEEMDDFFSSIRHPENIVLLERLVVNVKASSSSGPNPMGFFEFYIEASSDAAAIEINDRKAEVKDVMQRTIEEITYDDLVTAPGKNKLKLVLRKNINEVLTKGRVRKLFFKSVVIKP